MVRLQLAVCEDAFERCRNFQSHYGAIATRSFEVSKSCKAFFQSHYGAIATCVSSGLGRVDVNAFNPTMVRLQQRMAYLINVAYDDFQSHYGAIATLGHCVETRVSG